MSWKEALLNKDQVVTDAAEMSALILERTSLLSTTSLHSHLFTSATKSLHHFIPHISVPSFHSCVFSYSWEGYPLFVKESKELCASLQKSNDEHFSVSPCFLLDSDFSTSSLLVLCITKAAKSSLEAIQRKQVHILKRCFIQTQRFIYICLHKF